MEIPQHVQNTEEFIVSVVAKHGINRVYDGITSDAIQLVHDTLVNRMVRVLQRMPSKPTSDRMERLKSI